MSKAALEWALEKLGIRSFPPAFPGPIGQPQGQGKGQLGQSSPSSTKSVASMGQTRQGELALWKKWKDGGQKPEDLDPLLKSLNPLIQGHMRQYASAEIPTAALEMRHKQHAVEALRSYDPSKGQLASWVTTYLRKASRYVAAHRNIAYSPEAVTSKIGLYDAIKADLKDQLGHEPDDLSVVEHPLALSRGLTMKDVSRLNRERRKGLYESVGQTAQNRWPEEEEVRRLIYYELGPEERAVYEYTFGHNGKPQLKPGQIAKTLGMDATKVAKIRTSIRRKILSYMNP